MEPIGHDLKKFELGERWIQADCEIHGPYTSRLYLRTTWSACPGCVEDGYAAKRESFKRAERAAALDRWAEVVGSAGVPQAYAGARFETYQPTCAEAQTVLTAIVNYSDNLSAEIAAGRNAFMVGATGTGKTHLMCALVSRALADGRTAQFITATKIWRAMRATWHRGSTQTEADVLRALADVELLAIDEVQELDDQEGRWFFDLVNERYERGNRPIVMATNLDKQAMIQQFGQRTIDRLRDRHIAYRFTWESYRGRRDR
jgi:DNA replication protein DnaC